MDNQQQGIEIEKPGKIEIIYVGIMLALVVLAFIAGRMTTTMETFKDCREQYDVWIYQHCKCWENMSENPYLDDFRWNAPEYTNYSIPIFKEDK